MSVKRVAGAAIIALLLFWFLYLLAVVLAATFPMTFPGSVEMVVFAVIAVVGGRLFAWRMPVLRPPAPAGETPSDG